jgi:hypothetical protein
MLILLFVIIAGLVALCCLPILISLTLRALPLFIGLCMCWWLFHGCL